MEPLLIIIILVILAILLYAVEVFLVPGIGFAGIAATACVVVANVMVYINYDTTTAVIALLASIAVVLLLFYLLSHSRVLDRAALKANIDSTNATAAQLSVRVGDKGKALTRLALIGNARIEGKDVEVKSDGAFIDEGTPVVVTAVQDALILVKATDGNEA